jgi:tetratricopeptide (TPR) repeat protein
MKKVILYLIAASLVCCNYSCKKETTHEIYEKLEKAYQSSSNNDPEKFFTNWNESVSSNSKKDEYVEVIYAIFKDFYDPLDFEKLGEGIGIPSLYFNCKYFAVQNKIDYKVVDDELVESTSYVKNPKTINNFKPSLNLAKGQILYLLPEYEKALNMFLDADKDDIDKRIVFINPYIPIFRGHWGNYWHITTHPEINLVVLGKSKLTAKVEFRMGSQGGEAILKKEGNEWKVIESKATWIE